jgi:hypothetical protein
MGGERNTYGVHTGFWWGNVRERDQLEETSVDGRIVLKCIFKSGLGKAGLIWLRTGMGGGLL